MQNSKLMADFQDKSLYGAKHHNSGAFIYLAKIVHLSRMQTTCPFISKKFLGPLIFLEKEISIPPFFRKKNLLHLDGPSPGTI